MGSTAANNPILIPLKDRVAIVTGSSRGIGQAIVTHLAQLGAKVVINYTTNSDQADVVANKINSIYPGDGPRAITVKADVSDPVQVKFLFDSAEQAFGSSIHIFVNSAGVCSSVYPKIADTSVEEFDRTFRINTRGSFLCAKEAANRLKRGGGGRIILLTSSIVASLKPGYGTYAASKAANETLVKILAKELKGTKITANCVAPGPIATDMFFAGKAEETVQRIINECPHNRLGQCEDVAPIVGFLATDASEWVNGQIIRATGGHV